MRRLVLILFSWGLLSPLWAVESQAHFEFLVQNRTGELHDLSRLGFYSVQPGDRFQFQLSTPTQGRAYVFHLPSEGGVEFLGPRQEQMTFPAPRQWFTLDQNPGVEEFFVILAPKGLSDLDVLVANPDRSLELLTWIKDFRGRMSRFAGPSRQTLASIAAVVRGGSDSGILIPLRDIYAFSVILGR